MKNGYRNLNYDPALGRFLTSDPLGLAAGDTNFYRYVGNSPVNFTDPDGLDKKIVTTGDHAAVYLFNGEDPTKGLYIDIAADFTNNYSNDAFLNVFKGKDVPDELRIRSELPDNPLTFSYNEKKQDPGADYKDYVKAIEMQKKFKSGELKYNFYNFGSTEKSQNCYGFASGF